MYKEFGIKSEILELSKKVEKEIQPQFEKIEQIKELNSLKVLEAFQYCRLSEMHLHSSTGYGIDEIGRNKIEEIYARIFRTEDALVRAQLISGTHALAITLFGLLRPGDTLLSISGAPYDTLQTIIGISKEKSRSSLKEFGVNYEQIDLINDNFDIKTIQDRVAKHDIKLIEIQRSKGYSTRKSLTIDKIEKVIKAIREVNKDVIIMVDNCYGEFVEEKEPTEVGADIIVGSLMKNLGAGIATSGAYIAGKKGFCSINIEKSMMNSEIGFGRKVLQVFEDQGISFEHIPSGIDTLTVYVHQDEFEEKEQQVIAGIHRAVSPDFVEMESDLALIAVVGRGMKSTRGTAGRIFSALAHANVNVKMIDQGSSELNIIIGVENRDFEAAIKAIYDIFVLTQM